MWSVGPCSSRGRATSGTAITIATSSLSCSRATAISIPTTARPHRAKATSSTRRASAGTASTTPRTRTSCWWEDARVIRGMRAQLELRRKRLAAGDAPLGWKVGFAAPAMLERLNVTGPLVGFLTRNARVQSGGSVSLGGWVKPVAEPEIAVHIGRDVSAGADHETAKAAIAGISPAIEIVDLTAPPEDRACM